MMHVQHMNSSTQVRIAQYLKAPGRKVGPPERCVYDAKRCLGALPALSLSLSRSQVLILTDPSAQIWGIDLCDMAKIPNATCKRTNFCDAVWSGKWCLVTCRAPDRAVFKQAKYVGLPGLVISWGDVYASCLVRVRCYLFFFFFGYVLFWNLFDLFNSW